MKKLAKKTRATKAEKWRETWTSPQRAGKIFCSPSCGHGCTWADYNRAVRRADALMKKLGITWRAHVHESLGWKFTVSRGAIVFHGYATGNGKRYHVRANIRGLQSVSVDGTNPAKMLEAITRHLWRIQADVRTALFDAGEKDKLVTAKL
jgi:hypothetical protein